MNGMKSFMGMLCVGAMLVGHDAWSRPIVQSTIDFADGRSVGAGLLPSKMFQYDVSIPKSQNVSCNDVNKTIGSTYFDYYDIHKLMYFGSYECHTYPSGNLQLTFIEIVSPFSDGAEHMDIYHRYIAKHGIHVLWGHTFEFKKITEVHFKATLAFGTTPKPKYWAAMPDQKNLEYSRDWTSANELWDYLRDNSFGFAEKRPEDFLEHLVSIFGEVQRTTIEKDLLANVNTVRSSHTIVFRIETGRYINNNSWIQPVRTCWNESNGKCY